MRNWSGRAWGVGATAAALVSVWFVSRCEGPPMASYYAGEFQGRATASGERYDMEAMTAAHRTLAFGTRVRVTNLENGREVVVRINDRGPFVKGRVIDLSLAAARRLGMLDAGVVRVKLEVVGGGAVAG